MPIDANGNIIPDFGGVSPLLSTLNEGQGPETPAYSGPRKMAFICSKGNLDMAYPALIMANAALGEGVHVDIFFTFWGLDMVDIRTTDKLKFTFGGNTAMHMADLERIKGGLGTASMPQLMAMMPGMTAFSTKMMKKMMADLEIPSVHELIAQIAAQGAGLWACKLTVDMMKIKRANLIPEIQDIITATDFIELSEGAQIVFI